MRFLSFFCLLTLPLCGAITSSIIPMMDNVYDLEYGKKANTKQKDEMQQATDNKAKKMRITTYNMLYNEKKAEEALPFKHRWEHRKPRLKEYLVYTQSDIIGSQELQEDQFQEIADFLEPTYGCYGEKTRENEGRSDVNAIFFRKSRFELLDAKTIPYPHETYNNAFTFCHLYDKISDKKIVVINTKLSFGDVERRLKEATQLNEFSKTFHPKTPVIILGDFNTFPFLQDKRNPFYDGDFIIRTLENGFLKDVRMQSIHGHFGPICSITNCKKTFQPFAGAELPGFILDHIFTNDCIATIAHGIDTAQANGEYPSDHLPVLADVYLR